jgi:hypothetical protein
MIRNSENKVKKLTNSAASMMAGEANPPRIYPVTVDAGDIVAHTACKKN